MQLRGSMSTKVIYRSGMCTIGGTIIEVINNNDRIIFDFGCFFDPKINDETLPNVSGIYDNSSEYNDFVIISHDHLDHVKALNKVHPNIPIIMSYDSKKMLDSLKTVGFDQIIGNWRDYDTIELNQPTMIGSFEVTAIPVDHDVPGAVSYLIKNEDINILYTGDIRVHGINHELTEKMVEFAKTQAVDLLIIEGVSVSFIDDDYTFNPTLEVSEEVKSWKYVDHCLEQIDRDSLILFNPYIMNMELFYRFYELSLALNKKFVLLPTSSKQFSDFMPFVDNVYVLNEDTYNTGCPVITLEEIDSSCLLQFNYYDLKLYQSIDCHKQLIQAGGEPIGDFDPRYQQLIEYCQVNEIDFLPINISGHAEPDNLAYVINTINPQVLSPIHSFKPEMLTKVVETSILPKANECYTWCNHKLISDEIIEDN